MPDTLLDCAFEWYQKGRTKDVDGFTLVIRDKGLTHGNIAISLASKIMYLMNPGEVLPLDRLAKIGVQYKGNSYAGFFDEVERFRQKRKAEIHQSFEGVTGMLDIIESLFVGQIRDLEKIRENRFVDKWL